MSAQGLPEPPWWHIDDPTPDRVLAALGETFMTQARRVFKRDRTLQTILLTVAQYSADDANDEVHCSLFFSTGFAVPWPHRCPGAGGTDSYRCRFCLKSTDANVWGHVRLSLPERVASITRALEPFCLEGATQFMEADEADRPLFVMRRDAANAEFVGQLQRPWLRPDRAHVEPPSPDLAPLFAEIYDHPDADGPRLVLADCLQAAGDPRGTFIALQLHPNPTPAMHIEMARLEENHRNCWLGALLPVALPARCRFARGFVSTVALGAAPGEMFEALADSPAWATVDTVAFPVLTASQQDEAVSWVIFPRLRQTRRIEAPPSMLDEMADAGGEWGLTALHCIGAGSVRGCASLSLPTVRHLMLEDLQPDDLAQLSRSRWWGQITQIDLATVVPATAFAATVARTPAAVRATTRYDPRIVIERTGPTAARVRAALHDDAAGEVARLSEVLPDEWTVDTAYDLTPKRRLAVRRSFWTVPPER